VVQNAENENVTGEKMMQVLLMLQRYYLFLAKHCLVESAI
jgi:hypothetical protein